MSDLTRPDPIPPPPFPGVRLADGSELQADLVVDASGRFSRLPQWMEEAGLPKPPRKSVNGKVIYDTRIFKVRGGMLACTIRPDRNRILQD